MGIWPPCAVVAAVAAPQATCGAHVGRSQSVINVLTFALGIIVTTYIWRHRAWFLGAGEQRSPSGLNGR